MKGVYMAKGGMHGGGHVWQEGMCGGGMHGRGMCGRGHDCRRDGH